MHESTGALLPAAVEGFHRRQRQVYFISIEEAWTVEIDPRIEL